MSESRRLSVLGVLSLVVGLVSLLPVGFMWGSYLRRLDWTPTPAVLERAQLVVTQSTYLRKGQRRTAYDYKFLVSYAYDAARERWRHDRASFDDGWSVAVSKVQNVRLQGALASDRGAITVYVNPRDPSDAVIFPEVTSSFLLVSMIPLALIPLGLLRIGTPPRERDPDRPWRKEGTWEGFRVRAALRKVLPGYPGVRLWIALVVGPWFTLMIFEQWSVVDPESARTASLVCGAVFACLAVVSLPGWLRRLARPTLHLTELPVRPGYRFEGRIVLRRTLRRDDGAQISLVRRLPDARRNEAIPEPARQAEVTVPARTLREDGKVVPFALDVPAKAEETGFRVEWRLVLSRAGGAVVAEFEVPVHHAAHVERRAGPP